MSKIAGIVIIGNEVLSGKTQDTNSHFLCQELRALGVEVRRIVVIPDDISTIAAEVIAYSRQFDLVFTTGGVGPTHDDVTIAGIAQGFGVRVLRHPQLERRLRERHGDSVNDARLRLADVPEGAELVGDGSYLTRVVKLHNVYILPGIPQIMRHLFLSIKESFRESPFFLKVVYIKERESAIAANLNRLLEDFPDLLLGSYPVLNIPEYKVKVTLESKDRDYLNRALEKLLESLPTEAVQQVEDR
jgi:molybdenum cofactor synthesis domain-containing protein